MSMKRSLHALRHMSWLMPSFSHASCSFALKTNFKSFPQNQNDWPCCRLEQHRDLHGKAALEAFDSQLAHATELIRREGWLPEIVRGLGSSDPILAAASSFPRLQVVPHCSCPDLFLAARCLLGMCLPCGITAALKH